MMRAAQVIEGQLDIRVIDRPFAKDLAIHPEEGGPAWFGLLHHSADRPLKGITVLPCPSILHEEAELPVCTGVPCFLRKPYV